MSFREFLDEAMNIASKTDGSKPTKDTITKIFKIKNPTDADIEMIGYGYDNATNDKDGQPINRDNLAFKVGWFYKGIHNSKDSSFDLKQAEKNFNTIRLRFNKSKK